MASPKFVVLACVVLIAVCNANNIELGDATNATLAYTRTVQMSAVPEKNLSITVSYKDYKYNTVPRVIKAISVIDLDEAHSHCYLKSGGIGNTFVKIKLEGARGEALNYQVEVYV